MQTGTLDATLTKRTSTARRCVSPATGATRRRPWSRRMVGDNRNASPRVHGPLARCRIDRAKRRSECCPVHQSPLQGHRAAACDALLPIVVSSLRGDALLRSTRTTTLLTCLSAVLHGRPRHAHDLPARQPTDTRPKRAGTHLIDEACAKRGACAARKFASAIERIRTAITAVQDFLSALLWRDCDSGMTAIRADDIPATRR